MVNYELGKIYKIVCNTTGLIYIGSTCEPTLARRLYGHRASYNSFKKGLINFITSFTVLENENYEIILMENYECNSKDELHARERVHIEGNVCVNKVIPLRTTKEYYETNKETIIERSKTYYDTNKAELAEKRKVYCETNKDIIAERNKANRETSRDKSKPKYEMNKYKKAEQNKTYRKRNKEKLAKQKKAYYEANKVKKKA